MGRRGKKPLPGSIRAARGTDKLNPQRVNHLEPQPKVGHPECPVHLTGIARAEWYETCEQLDQMNVLTVADRSVIELYCVTYAAWRESLEGCKKGTTIMLASGSEAKNPAQTVRETAGGQMKQQLAELGLTPSSRTGIKANGPPKTNPFAILKATS